VDLEDLSPPVYKFFNSGGVLPGQQEGYIHLISAVIFKFQDGGIAPIFEHGTVIGKEIQVGNRGHLSIFMLIYKLDRDPGGADQGHSIFEREAIIFSRCSSLGLNRGRGRCQ